MVWLPSIYYFPWNIGNGMSSSQLTNKQIFQRGGEKPPTSWNSDSMVIWYGLFHQQKWRFNGDQNGIYGDLMMFRWCFDGILIEFDKGLVRVLWLGLFSEIQLSNGFVGLLRGKILGKPRFFCSSSHSHHAFCDSVIFAFKKLVLVFHPMVKRRRELGVSIFFAQWGAQGGTNLVFWATRYFFSQDIDFFN